MQTIEMLKSLCQANGVSGAEENALAVAEQLCEGLGACHRTVHKSLVCQVMPPQQGRPHLLLDAHIDEIGLVVTYIEEGGFLRVGQAGGVDRRLVMGSPVVVHAKSGDIPGVVGSVPPHIQSGEKKNPQIDEIWIDTGLDEKEVREQIDLGDSISFVGPFTQLLGGLVSSKAFDDRCCCVAVIFARELIVSGFRMVAADSGIVIAADKIGKLKTVTQDISVVLLLVFGGLYELIAESVAAEVVNYVALAMFALSALLTVLSGVNYIIKNVQVLKV